MRIGIDGRWFFSGNASGRLVTRQLLRHLIRFHPEHEYVVFLRRSESGLEFPFAAPNVRLLHAAAGNGIVANGFLVPWAARKLGLDVCLFFYFCFPWGHCRKVVFIHDLIFLDHPEYFSWKERLYFWPMRWLKRTSARFCTISHSERERMLKLRFAAAERISVVPLGVEERFRPMSGHSPERLREVRAAYGLPGRFLLYVGRLNVRKNIGNLLQAMALLQDREIHLVLAGKTDWRMFDLQGKIRELGLLERVSLAGEVSDGHLPVLFALATVFCYPSFAEGFGLPPLEAMASGVPVVISDRDSLPEVCGPAGTYVDPDQPAGIARAIDALLSDPHLWEAKRALGLERARSFTWRRSTETLLGMFREMLSQ